MIDHTVNEPHQPGDCILFSTADWDTPYWTNKQHTAAHLGKAGWRVLYVESIGLRAPKLSSGMDWRRIAKRLWRGIQGPRKVADGIWVYSPLVIPFRHDHQWIRALNQGLLSRRIATFIKRYSFSEPVVWTYHPFILEILYRLNVNENCKTGQLLYHCVDDLSAIPGVDAKAFNQEEVRLLQQADAVFTTSRTLYEKCLRYNPRVQNLPNVVDFEHFAGARKPGTLPVDLENIPKPRLTYVGALSDFKVDFSLLLEVSTNNPAWQFIFIGDEREGQHDPILAKLVSQPNVHCLGHRQYEHIPDYLRGMDVGLLPTRINEYTRSMFPMKFYEYIAAGLPVVSTPLEFTRTQKAGVFIADGAAEFTKSIGIALQQGRLPDDLCTELVGNNTWADRLEKMLIFATVSRSDELKKISPQADLYRRPSGKYTDQQRKQ